MFVAKIYESMFSDDQNLPGVYAGVGFSGAANQHDGPQPALGQQQPGLRLESRRWKLHPGGRRFLNGDGRRWLGNQKMETKSLFLPLVHQNSEVFLGNLGAKLMRVVQFL